MDEPLSNLDAKLRVQMRSEIARIQHDLGVTTIYVTHDQTEAMTMGDRVAVLRKGELQQVDNPQTLYERPVNLFVAGFIGSPAMNLLDAKLDRHRRRPRRGGRRVPSPGARRARSRRDPTSAGTRAGSSCSASGPKTWRTRRSSRTRPPSAASRSTVDLREALGFRRRRALHRSRAPAAMTDDVKELAVDVGTEALEHVATAGAKAGTRPMLARLNPRTKVRTGDPVELVVDTAPPALLRSRQRSRHLRRRRHVTHADGVSYETQGGKLDAVI